MAVFDAWLSEYREPSVEERKKQREEWDAFRKLCDSDANRHSYGKHPSKTALDRARKGVSEGKRLLVELLKTCGSNRKSPTRTAFPLTSFVALFGGPGLHGYGKHEINTEECTSKVDIVEIEELLVSSKIRTLGLDCSCEVRIDYNRKEESASANIQQNGAKSTDYTLKDLWRRQKRQKTAESAVEVEYRWTCSTCTFIHVGKSKLDYLLCELCGSES